MTAELDGELLAAMTDAEKGGVGWVKIQRLVQNAHGAFRLTRVDPAVVVQLDNFEVYLDHLVPLVAKLPCAHCAAVPGEPCRTPAGRRTPFHSVRSRPVYEGWWLGHRDGLVDAFRRLTRDWTTPPADLLRKHGARWT